MVLGGQGLHCADRHLEQELPISCLFDYKLLELDRAELAAVIIANDETVAVRVKLLDAATVEALVSGFPAAHPAQTAEGQQTEGWGSAPCITRDCLGSHALQTDNKYGCMPGQGMIADRQ